MEDGPAPGRDDAAGAAGVRGQAAMGAHPERARH
jgi:hypothetical protein